MMLYVNKPNKPHIVYKSLFKIFISQTKTGHAINFIQTSIISEIADIKIML